jgi:hypothetical protein
MLTEGDLRELLSYQAHKEVLSLFLSTEPADGNADIHRLRLRSMLKEVNLPEDSELIQRYFDHEHDWSGRSVAVFSCAPEGFFKVFTLAVPIRSRIRVNDRPFVKPLADLLDSYGGYGVVLVDKQGARLFYFHLGELREQEGIVGETVRHTKRGGASTVAGRRGGVAGRTDYVEEVTERNIKDAVEFSTQFFSENNVRRIVIGGSEENVAMFRNLLPKSWQSLVVGQFTASMTVGHAEVLVKAMEIGQAAEEQREQHLVEQVTTNAAKGRGGVIQLEDTLQAVREGRVQMLIIHDGFRAPGYQCLSCGYLSSQRLESCPFCSANCRRIEDVVDLAVRQVMQGGGEVEVLHVGQAADHLQIGALLRY